MKKKFSIALLPLTVIVILTFTACSHTFTCGICGKEKNEVGHKTEIMGRSLEICNSCYDSYKSLFG